MRILHIFDHSVPLHSGYTFRSKAILDEQALLGWDTYHITSSKHTEAADGYVPKENIDGRDFYRTERISPISARLPVVNQVLVATKLASRIEEIIEDVRPDILHAHSPSLNGLAGYWVARRHGLPLVYEVRAFWEDAAVDHGTSKEWGVRYRLTRGLETYVLKHANAVTTICEGLRQDILNRGISSSKVTVIPNAVDINAFNVNEESSSGFRTGLELGSDPVIGFIGSFYAYEGLDLLLRAMVLLKKDMPQLKLLLVGGGPEEDRLKEIAKNNSLDDSVIFTGRVPHDRVQEYYNAIDLLVYPRISMRLTDIVTPLKPLESMAQKKLVLASNVGGHKELIEDGRNGYLFQADNVTSLCNSILEIFSHREKWEKVKNNGRHYVEQERNWRSSVSRYAQVYEQLTGR